MNSAIKIIIALLAVLAIFLGYKVYLTYAPAPSARDSGIQSDASSDARAVRVNISGCVADPATTTVSLGKSLVFVNQGSTDHQVVFSPQRYYMVKAKSSVTVLVDFEQGQGIYGYGCDRSGKAVGHVMVTD